MNIATTLTLSRLVIFAPLGAIFVYLGNWTLALTMIIIGLITDVLDGYFARKRNEVTRLGSALDGISDKFFFFLVIMALFFRYELPAYYLLILTRDVLVAVICLVVILFYAGFKQIHMHATMSGKVVTFLQSITIGLIVFNIWGFWISEIVVRFFIVLTFIAAIVCVLDYIIAFFKGRYHRKHMEFVQEKKYKKKKKK